MSIVKLLTYDTETTGNNPEKCGIRQISGLITFLDLINSTYEHKEEFTFNVRPNFERLDLQVSQEALNIGPVPLTIEEIKQYPDLKIIHSQVVDILNKYVKKYDKKDKFFLNGFNNRKFDDTLLRQWFLDAGDKYQGSLMWSNTIDTSILASNYLMFERPEMENFKQSTVAKQLGILVDDEKLHDAKYDNRICFNIFRSINNYKRHDGRTE